MPMKQGREVLMKQGRQVAGGALCDLSLTPRVT